MLISGIQKMTLLDFPDRVACIIFTAGCNFRCGYCHNPEFVLPEEIQKLKNSFIPEVAFFNFLETRRGFLEGVVVSGGEPTLQPDLPEFLKKIKQLGFLVKLDTNGSNFTVVKKIIENKLADYIAMDAKTGLPGYRDFVGAGADTSSIAETAELLKAGDIDYEFRTTLIKEIHTPAALEALKDLVRGGKKLYLQQFRPGHTLSPAFASFHPFSVSETAAIAKDLGQVVKKVEIR